MYTNSVQLLYSVSGGVDGWSIFFGPQGEPVDPCDVLPFSRVLSTEGAVVPDGSIDKPPFPRAGTWAGLPDLHKDVPCLIICEGEGPPLLQCAELLESSVTLMVGFKKDPQYEDATVECGDGVKYHRGFYAEYSA